MQNEPIAENGTCKRCGRKGTILSNGYCVRCDDVLYGKKEENYQPWIPKPIPIQPFIPEYPRPTRRKEYWCLDHKRQ